MSNTTTSKRLAFPLVWTGAFCAAVLMTAVAQASVIYQDGENNILVQNYAGTSDNTLLTGSNTARNANYGAFRTFLVAGGAKPRRALLRFDLSSLAGNYTSIDHATLHLTIDSFTGSGTVSVYRIADGNAGWVEGTSASDGALVTPNAGESTWNNLAYDATNPVAWTGGAGLGLPGYETPQIGSFSFDAQTTAGQVISIDLPVGMVNDWITGTNAGLLLRFADETSMTGLIQFDSGEAAISGGVNPRPALEISYSVPEPATGLIGLGGIMGLLLLRNDRALRQGKSAL
jgi:hypothetical protein